MLVGVNVDKYRDSSLALSILTAPAGRWCCMVVGNFEIFPKNLPVSSMMGWIRKW